MFTITKKEFELLSAYIKANYGINLKEEKKALVTGRLYNVLVQHDLKNFTEYFEYIQNDKTGDAVTTLINKITTNHTFFMRESEHFYYFRDKVLPYLVKRKNNKDLRIWSAGCSSGEEPYTLAMIIYEFLGKEKVLWDSKILATDISSKVLDIAKKAIYSIEKLENLPVTWKLNYFQKIDSENFELVDKMKNEVIFRKFNLMNENFPFKRKFDVIFCRNVMIYFDDRTKDQLVSKFYSMLEPGGYLFIGQSESLNREVTKLRYIMPAVYRKD